MRVLLWSSTFWPHIGGVEVLGANLVGALVERDHEVVVLARRDTDDLPEHGEVAGAPIRRLRFRQAIESRDPGEVLDLRTEVARIKRTLRPDVVHLYHLGPDLLFQHLTADVSPAPVLVTLHQSFAGDLKEADVALGRTLREAAAVATCSTAVLEDVLGRLPDLGDRVRSVPNALPPAGLDPGPVPDGPPVVLLVGRVVPQKGFDLGLEAFAHLHRRQPDARLVVAGDGIARPALEAQVREQGLGDAVTFVGWADPARVRALMAAATLVVMPSRFEPFGLVALEAGQSRRPVVAFAVDGLVEAVRHGVSGLLTAPGDTDALAEAVTRVATDPVLARRLGDGGHDPEQAERDWDAHVGAYEGLYARLRASGAPG